MLPGKPMSGGVRHPHLPRRSTLPQNLPSTVGLAEEQSVLAAEAERLPVPEVHYSGHDEQ